jgi:kynurenine formamidase
LRDRGQNGRSALIGKPQLEAWQKQHRAFRLGDVVLFMTGYSDRYYQPLPAGRRFLADPLEAVTPAWPDPDPEALDYLGSLQVMAAGTDSPSMGPIPDLAEATHLGWLRHGMIWTESATNFGALPATGAFYCMLGPKYAGGIASEARAFAITGSPLAQTLIDSVRNKRAVDLSVTLEPDRPLAWTGKGAGNHRHPFLTINWQYNPSLDYYAQLHMFDSHTGTHLVPPSYALPAPGFDNRQYAPEVRGWLAEYERRFGPRGVSNTTVEKVALSQTSGWARVIDVRSVMGKTQRQQWPASPAITVPMIQEYEKRTGELRPGEVVLFQTGYSNLCQELTPAGKACLTDAIEGRREGWPAPSPEVIRRLASRGVQAVGTDAPTLGGVVERNALMAYWALGTAGMAGIEYLTNLDQLPERAYFLFAAPKIRGAHGSPGRAIGLY